MAGTGTPVLVLLGPTASGKSALALELAGRLSGELISCDSMQVYRGLPIGTAQPSEAERLLVPHHLVSCLDLSEPWNANLFVPAAKRFIEEIQGRGRVPIVVGGTGLYAKALCYDFQLLPSDGALSAVLQQESATTAGRARLLKELSDAVGEIPIDIQQNPRHLARAAEVFRLTGKAPWQLRQRAAGPLGGFRQFCLLPDFPLLKERIRLRTASMISEGWIEECEEALRNGLSEAPTAWQALGYRDIADFLAGNGPKSVPELTELLANRTIQYARRQLTWFRHQHPGAVFLSLTGYNSSAWCQLSVRISELFSS